MGRTITWRATFTASIALGAGDVLAGALASGYGPLALRPETGLVWLQYVSGALGSGWAWALFAFVLGWLSPSPRTAAVRGLVGLVVAVLGYYAAKAAIGMTDGLSTAAVAIWAQVSLLAGPLMGWLGHVARRPSWRTLPAALAAPAVMLLDSSLRPAGPRTGSPPLPPIVMAGAVLLAAVLVRRAAVAEQEGEHAIT